MPFTNPRNGHSSFRL